MVLSKHWLLLQNLDSVLNFNKKFFEFTLFGMNDIETYVNSGGRPYGDLGVLWYKYYNNINVKVNDVDYMHRCLAIGIKAVKSTWLMFYMLQLR